MTATETWAQFAARRLREESPPEIIDLFEEPVTLVPMPRSSLYLEGAHWPSLRICECLVQQGLGSEVQRLLRRTTALPSSSQAGRHNRPTVHQKYESLAVQRDLTVHPTRLLLVDDLVTKGHDMFAGALRLSEAYPGVPLRGFGMALTRGFVEDIENVKAPFRGFIRREDTWTVRRDDPD